MPARPSAPPLAELVEQGFLRQVCEQMKVGRHDHERRERGVGRLKGHFYVRADPVAYDWSIQKREPLGYCASDVVVAFPDIDVLPFHVFGLRRRVQVILRYGVRFGISGAMVGGAMAR